MRKAVLLDKDGTLVENVPYNVDPAKIRLTKGAEVALPRLSLAGYRVAVVSNQPGVALGHFDESALAGMEARVGDLLAGLGVCLDGFFYCPHHPDAIVDRYRARCTCRKPKPGLVRRAMAALGTDANSTWMVGDILDDVEAGRRVGCRTILFDSGGETEWYASPLREPHFVVRDFAKIADIILGMGGM